MSNSIQCPACKQQIDSDSFYCDQCGLQILVCSVCGRPGKGKRCSFDGKELVLPVGAVQPSATTHISQPSSSAPAPVQSASVSTPAPLSNAPSAGANKIKLISQSHGIVIDASDGDILGRTKGNFAPLLGKFSHISGNHCQILNSGGVWSIKDLGSTNGTFYNGGRLNPGSPPAALKNDDVIKLADIEFKVSIEKAEADGTTRI